MRVIDIMRKYRYLNIILMFFLEGIFKRHFLAVLTALVCVCVCVCVRVCVRVRVCACTCVHAPVFQFFKIWNWQGPHNTISIAILSILPNNRIFLCGIVSKQFFINMADQTEHRLC